MGLALRDIRHSYGDGWVVDGAAIEASAGEIVCLFGPSGCGKTTLLRIAAGLEPLQQGFVEIDGEALNDTPAEKRPLGFVFQDFVLFPHLTIDENAAFGLNGVSAAEKAETVRAELAAVDLAPYADRYPHQLSGGQQQRAALARAFARRPRAMLLDEPFASIDAALRRRLRAEMRRLLKARSVPAILVTHDAAEAIELGDRIAVMREGRIVETASPETLFRNPATVAGAAIFPGSQTVPCTPIEGGVATAFGEAVHLDRPADAGFLVIHEGGAFAEPDTAAANRVIDCRFHGPDWTVAVDARREKILAGSTRPLEAGEAVKICFNPSKLRALPA